MMYMMRQNEDLPTKVGEVTYIPKGCADILRDLDNLEKWLIGAS